MLPVKRPISTAPNAADETINIALSHLGKAIPKNRLNETSTSNHKPDVTTVRLGLTIKPESEKTKNTKYMGINKPVNPAISCGISIAPMRLNS